MPASTKKIAHKLGANRWEIARNSDRARNRAESTDVHEDRGTVKAKFSRPERTVARLAGPQRSSNAPHRASAALTLWPETKLLPEHSSGAEFHVVHLRLFKDGAQEVSVVGTFNDWRPQRTRVHQNGGGEWEVDLSLASGDYEYRFVVDGQWMNDPFCCRQVPNPFGSTNSILHVHGKQLTHLTPGR